MKAFYFIANWKLNGSPKLVTEYLNKLEKIPYYESIQIMIAPPYTLLNFFNVSPKLQSNYHIIAQDVSFASEGAFTGEIRYSFLFKNFSSFLLKQVNASGSIIGHSERRRLFDENDIVKTHA